MQIDIQQFGNNKVGVLEVTNDEALQIIKSLSSQLRGEDSLDIPRDFRCHGLATELTIIVDDYDYDNKDVRESRSHYNES